MSCEEVYLLRGRSAPFTAADAPAGSDLDLISSLYNVIMLWPKE